MTTEKSLIDSTLRGWKFNVERAEKLFGDLSSEQLEREVAPGKNRLINLWGHLAATNDRLLPLLGIGERLHPEFDGMFISNPDGSVPLKVAFGTRGIIDATADDIELFLRERLHQHIRTKTRNGYHERGPVKPATVHQELRIRMDFGARAQML
jgi:hypothetical protein